MSRLLELKGQIEDLEREIKWGQDHPYAGVCGEDDARASLLDDLHKEFERLNDAQRHPFFDFGMQADEAEQLYRLLNLSSHDPDLEPHEARFITEFQARLLGFLDKHPVKYGS